MVQTDIKFKVGMTCQGCANAVVRILSKIDGVEDVQTSVEKQEVVVKYNHADAPDTEDMLGKLLKWGSAAGKSVALVEATA